MNQQNSCPPHCQVKLAAIEARLDKMETKAAAIRKDAQQSQEKCRDGLLKDIIHLEEEVVKRPKTGVMLAVVAIAVGIISGLFSAIWMQDIKMTAKIDDIGHKQIEVMTTLKLHLKEAEKIMEYHKIYPAEKRDEKHGGGLHP